MNFLGFVFHTVFYNVFFHMFSRVAVDCGFPGIPEDSIIHLVGSDNPHTQYKDQVQFNCSSKYYTLEGEGDYRKFELIHFLFPLLNVLFKFSDFIYMLSSTFQTHTLAMPMVNGQQMAARQRCQNALKVQHYILYFYNFFLIIPLEAFPVSYESTDDSFVYFQCVGSLKNTLQVQAEFWEVRMQNWEKYLGIF